MIYMRVDWLHEFDDEPVTIYSELDESRWEQRKVEIFRDGRMQFADAMGCSGDTGLSIEPIPEMKEIEKDKQFVPKKISKEMFEAVWAHRQGR